MKKSVMLVVFLSIFLVLLFSFSFSNALTQSQNQKVNFAYDWLEAKLDTPGEWNSLSVEQNTFALFAVSYNETLLEMGKDSLYTKSQDLEGEPQCWPSIGCDIKSTALALLTLSELERKGVEVNLQPIKDWLWNQKQRVSFLGNVNWLLQIDSTERTNCSIIYDNTQYNVTIFLNKTVKINQPTDTTGKCLGTYNNYIFDILETSNPACAVKTYSITCDENFWASMPYLVGSGSSVIWNIPSVTLEGPPARSFEIKTYCMPLLPGGSCNYESTLWATYALNKAGYTTEVESLKPYLLNDRSANKARLPDAFLYLITGDEANYVTPTLLNVSDTVLGPKTSGQDNYWCGATGGCNALFDTAIAMMAVDKRISTSSALKIIGKAENWTLNKQKTGTNLDLYGCFSTGDSCSGALRDTAAALSFIFPRGAKPSNDCTIAGYACEASCADSRINGTEVSQILGQRGTSLTLSCSYGQQCCMPNECLKNPENGFDCKTVSEYTSIKSTGAGIVLDTPDQNYSKYCPSAKPLCVQPNLCKSSTPAQAGLAESGFTNNCLANCDAANLIKVNEIRTDSIDYDRYCGTGKVCCAYINPCIFYPKRLYNYDYECNSTYYCSSPVNRNYNLSEIGIGGLFDFGSISQFGKTLSKIDLSSNCTFYYPSLTECCEKITPPPNLCTAPSEGANAACKSSCDATTEIELKKEGTTNFTLSCEQEFGEGYKCCQKKLCTQQGFNCVATSCNPITQIEISIDVPQFQRSCSETEKCCKNVLPNICQGTEGIGIGGEDSLGAACIDATDCVASKNKIVVGNGGKINVTEFFPALANLKIGVVNYSTYCPYKACCQGYQPFINSCTALGGDYRCASSCNENETVMDEPFNADCQVEGKLGSSAKCCKKIPPVVTVFNLCTSPTNDRGLGYFCRSLPCLTFGEAEVWDGQLNSACGLTGFCCKPAPLQPILENECEKEGYSCRATCAEGMEELSDLSTECPIDKPSCCKLSTPVTPPTQLSECIKNNDACRNECSSYETEASEYADCPEGKKCCKEKPEVITKTCEQTGRECCDECEIGPKPSLDATCGVKSCCLICRTKPQLTTKTCYDLGGETCEYDRECTGRDVTSSDTSSCCIEGSCKAKPAKCSEQGGETCPTNKVCNAPLTASDTEFCCQVGQCKGKARTLLWIIVISLAIIAALLFFFRKSLASMLKPKPKAPPRFYPPPTVPARPMPTRPMPPARPMPAPTRPAPAALPRPSAAKKTPEEEETFKKLRRISEEK